MHAILRQLMTWSAIVVLASMVVPTLNAQTAKPPNILLIVADDLGYGELGCYGQRLIRTPHLDQLAAGGMRFTQCYSGQAVCAPSRCSLLTGYHQGHAYIRDNANPTDRVRPAGENELYFPGQHPIPDATTTFAELLRNRGYVTGAAGKWGLGYEGSTGDPLRQGFAQFYGYLCQMHAHNHYPRYLFRNGEKELQLGNTRGATGATYSQDRFVEFALDFIQQHHEQPFFLYLPFAVPHLAIQVPEASLAEYVDEISEEPYEHRGYIQHAHPRAGYAAMVTHMDAGVGRILDQLDRLGISDHTLVLFTSDNGPTHDRVGGSDSDFFQSSGPFRGRKGSLWEGGIRVPLIARWPGVVPAGTSCDHACAFWDFLPTLCDIAGADIPEGLDGISFRNALRGQVAEQTRHEFLYWEFPGYGGQQAVRVGDWKAIRVGLHKKPDAPFQLYHLTDDPQESRDVAAEQPTVVQQLQQIAQREHIPSELFPFPALD